MRGATGAIGIEGGDEVASLARQVGEDDSVSVLTGRRSVGLRRVIEMRTSRENDRGSTPRRVDLGGAGVASKTRQQFGELSSGRNRSQSERRRRGTSSNATQGEEYPGWWRRWFDDGLGWRLSQCRGIRKRGRNLERFWRPVVRGTCVTSRLSSHSKGGQ